MKLLRREKFKTPINLLSGDSISLNYTDERGRTTTVLSAPITKKMTVVEGAIWELEEGDENIFGSSSGLVGAFLE